MSTTPSRPEAQSVNPAALSSVPSSGAEPTSPTSVATTGVPIDHIIFDQLLEMDDDDEHEFSKSIVWTFFEQAEATFNQMEQAIAERQFSKASELGHFLKGSSAALGMTKVKTSCERIQHFGVLKAADGVAPIDETEAHKRLVAQVQQVRIEYVEGERYLKQFYGDS